VLVIALVLTIGYRHLWKSSHDDRRAKKKKKGRSDAKGEVDYRTFVERAGGSTKLMLWLLVALGIFIAVNVLFYSSFFTNYPQGVYDALKTFQFWTKTGQEAHKHPVATYIWWLLLEESPLLVLGTIGAVLAVLKPALALDKRLEA